MPRILLTNESYFAATAGSRIIGSDGAEQVAVFDGVTDLEIAGNVERLDLAGDIADFTFSATGATLSVFDAAGRPVAVLADAGGKVLAFRDGAVNLSFDAPSLTLTLGGVAVPGVDLVTGALPTPAPVVPQPGAVNTGLVSQSPDFTLVNTAPFFALTPNASQVSEGDVATFTLTTTNVEAGTDVDYTITGVSASDVVGGLTGTATVGAGGTASITVPIVADELTEGSETLTLSLDNGQASASTVVLDTSVASANSYISGQGGNGVTSDFNIEVVFESGFSSAERAAFETAADYLSALITGDLPDEGAIDDIRITAVLEPIIGDDGQPDGPFGILAFAGPTVLRPGSFLPSEGRMTFDTADSARQVSDGTFTNTVMHEMVHALGFGTIWANFPGLATSGADARFTGDNAIAAYNAEFPSLADADPSSDFGVPLESEGGHWAESLFTTEILTPILDASTDYMSALTVASLEDLGYDTIFDVSIPGATMPQLNDFMFA